MKLNVGGTDYTVEFRHVRLYKLKEITVITTCVVVCDRFIAIENAVCSSLDNFSRPDGRFLALSKIIQYCGALKPAEGMALRDAVVAAMPGKAPVARPKKVPLTQEAVDKLKESGAVIREYRERLRVAQKGAEAAADLTKTADKAPTQAST